MARALQKSWAKRSTVMLGLAKKHLRMALFVTAASTFPQLSGAVGVIQGTVAYVEQQERAGIPTLLVRTTQTGSGNSRPTCHTFAAESSTLWMMIDMSTEQGRAMAALTTAAKLTGAPIYIVGTGACFLDTTIEIARIVSLT